jgi:hypothetical protein
MNRRKGLDEMQERLDTQGTFGEMMIRETVRDGASEAEILDVLDRDGLAEVAAGRMTDADFATMTIAALEELASRRTTEQG